MASARTVEPRTVRAPHGVAAPARVAALLARTPDGPVPVRHQSALAVYVEIEGRCVGIVAPGAARVPCALRLGAVDDHGFSARQLLADAGESAYVGRGILRLSGTPLPVRRFVDVRVPRVAPSGIPRQPVSPADVLAHSPRTAAAGLTVRQAVLARLAESLGELDGLGPLPAYVDVAATRLVGRGGGLTPLGDDVLAGWLAVLAVSGRLEPAVDAAIRALLHRTTTLSATLLDCALHGEAVPEMAAYLAAFGTNAEDEALAALLGLGHTSGAGLWWGATHALSTLSLRPAA